MNRHTRRTSYDARRRPITRPAYDTAGGRNLGRDDHRLGNSCHATTNGQRHEALSVRFEGQEGRCASGMSAGVVFDPALRVIFVLDFMWQPIA
jgi:hypothetical protein